MPELPTMRLMLLCCLLGGWLFAADSVAQDKLTADQEQLKFYDVEIILFRNLSVPKGHEYNFPTPAADLTKNTLDLSDPASLARAQEKGFSVLKDGEFRLGEQVKRIINSSRYQLLAHLGWRQPGLDDKDSVPVWVKGGRLFSNRYTSIDQAQPKSFDNSSTVENPAQEKATPATENTEESKGNAANRINQGSLYELEGKITVTLSRYLHTDARLVLRKPAAPATNIERNESSDPQAPNEPDMSQADTGGLLLNYELNEKRRMRSKRLHYLDHPEFGMLVMITPYDKTAVMADEEIVAEAIKPETDQDKAASTQPNTTQATQ